MCPGAHGCCHRTSLSPWCWRVCGEGGHGSWHTVESPEAPLKSLLLVLMPFFRVYSTLPIPGTAKPTVKLGLVGWNSSSLH